ncbi:MAG: winged helix-turn-helix domain-containing protein [Nocardioides sp.]|uniref:winged helix-turn-helix domain-containing protein n=1 Tax=Nocardioides sp. TaxID=35761 RepID=UPI003EFCD35F
MQPYTTPDPQALRALAHPLRVRLLGLLRVEGPATATSLAHRLDLNSGATSYHLRQLATHGFIEEDTTRGTGRERWWRAAHASTRSAPGTTPEERETDAAYLQAVATTYGWNLQRAAAQDATLSEEWRAASTMSDWVVRLTPERARELKERMAAVAWEFYEDEDPEDAPGARTFSVNLNTFPWPEGPVE